MKDIETLHARQEHIHDLCKAASGLLTAHFFIAEYHEPYIIFQGPEEAFAGADIKHSQDMAYILSGVPYVYAGVLDPDQALLKAIELQRQLCAESGT